MSTRLAEQWGVPAIALAALFIALVGLTHLLLRSWVRRQSRRYEAGARWLPLEEPRWPLWLTRALHEMLQPAAVVGLHLASCARGNPEDAGLRYRERGTP